MRVSALLAALTTATVVGAGGCRKATSPIDPGPPVATTTVTISSTGASPRNIEVAAGSRVRFVNQDARSHNMTSDPHPEHNECLEINQVGFLASGQSRETGNLVQPRTCGFHDHDNPEILSLYGQIVIR